jgi:hypothetical protein
MRDRTRSRNYSAERDEFRREHERHRAWGLIQRYGEKGRRLRRDAAARQETTAEVDHGRDEARTSGEGSVADCGPATASETFLRSVPAPARRQPVTADPHPTPERQGPPATDRCTNQHPATAEEDPVPGELRKRRGGHRQPTAAENQHPAAAENQHPAAAENQHPAIAENQHLATLAGTARSDTGGETVSARAAQVRSDRARMHRPTARRDPIRSGAPRPPNAHERPRRTIQQGQGDTKEAGPRKEARYPKEAWPPDKREASPNKARTPTQQKQAIPGRQRQGKQFADRRRVVDWWGKRQCIQVSRAKTAEP